jgi:hypothetical protein
VFTGGDVIIDYRVSIAEQGAAFSILSAGVTATTYTATGLTSGVTYEFKVESRNSYDHGSSSEALALLAAFKPDAPDIPTTAVVGNQALISWNEPIDNGSPITGYRVFIQANSEGDFIEETVDCVGQDADVVSNRLCLIALDTLIIAPYSLILN